MQSEIQTLRRETDPPKKKKWVLTEPRKEIEEKGQNYIRNEESIAGYPSTYKKCNKGH